MGEPEQLREAGLGRHVEEEHTAVVEVTARQVHRPFLVNVEVVASVHAEILDGGPVKLVGNVRGAFSHIYGQDPVGALVGDGVDKARVRLHIPPDGLCPRDESPSDGRFGVFQGIDRRARAHAQDGIFDPGAVHEAPYIVVPAVGVIVCVGQQFDIGVLAQHACCEQHVESG